MKRAMSQHLKPSVFFLTALLLLINLSCDHLKAPVSVLSKKDHSYTVLQIANDYGKPLVFNATEDRGAVGYELDGQLFWLKGQPNQSGSDSLQRWTWSQDERTVTMQVEMKPKNLEFTFFLESGEKPSSWHLNLAASEDAYFCGVFERVADGHQNESWKDGITTGLNLRGERMDVKLKPTVSAYAPFFVSSENYAFFAQGSWPGVIDFCREKPNLVQIAFEGPRFSFSLMTDRNPAELVKRHALETGPSFVPPRWAFGPWRWRDEHFHNRSYFDGSPVHAPYNSDLVEDILMMQAYDIPCTAYWIDRPWGPGVDGFDDYLIDGKRLPAFEKMITWLNGKDIELMLWIGPFVMGEMGEQAKEHGYEMVSKVRNNLPQVLIDFSNPEACKWWGENGPAKLAKMGVKGFKLDRADGEKLCDSLHLITSSGKTYRENYNDYPRQYVKAAYDAVQPILKDDFVLFPRAQYTGSAKYGAMWAGDTGNPAEGLRSALIGMQRCAVMGYPVWGSDTGGYPKRIDRETTIRWMGFSCFSPLMEVGPTNNRGFWGMDSEPVFDQELLAAWRFCAKLRMSLVDYIHMAAKTAAETGMPVVRPLFLEYPDQPECRDDWSTYKLGDDLLVSVIWEKGKTQQKVWLPAGETWVNLWDNREYEGGRQISVEAALHQLPVFLRKGSTLQLPDFQTLYKESAERAAVRYKMAELEERERWN
jgi:alpha-glucosidase (family GH31 glycosyl hydrolase)